MKQYYVGFSNYIMVMKQFLLLLFLVEHKLSWPYLSSPVLYGCFITKTKLGFCLTVNKGFN